MALERLRGRMPLVAFILLAVVCLALIGLACACLDDGFAQSFDRALQAPAAVTDAWPPATVAMLASLLPLALWLTSATRASPAMLQRFLF